MKRQRAHIRVASIVTMASVALVTTQSKATEPPSIIASASTLAKGLGYLQSAYSAYTTLNGIFNPQPTTAELIQAAVDEISALIVDVSLNTYYDRARSIATAYATAQTQPTTDNWKKFENDALDFLDSVSTAVSTPGPGAGPRFAHGLAGLYNAIMPQLLAIHLVGAQWNLPLFPQSRVLGTDYHLQVLTLVQRALQLDYSLVSASVRAPYSPGASVPTSGGDQTRQSALFQYIKKHYDNKCLDRDDVCAVFFMTDPIVQAIQKTGAGIYNTFSIDPLFANISILANPFTGASDIVNIPASWGNNWQGYENALWIPMYMKADGAFVKDRRCPANHGIVGVWNIPHKGEDSKEGWWNGFLCQLWPVAPDWLPTSTNIEEEVQSSAPAPGGGGVTLGYSCGTTQFVSGNSDAGQFMCRNRLDLVGGPKFPIQGCPPGGCGAGVDSPLTPKNNPPTGAFTALPAGTYLVGANFTGFQQNGYTYYYSPAVFPSGIGSMADNWNAGGIPLLYGANQSYPRDFSIFVRNNVTGLQDVRGPVAAGGNIRASNFSINGDSNQMVGLVAGGSLNLPTGGTVKGRVYVGGTGGTISPYATLETPRQTNPVNFAEAFSKLENMSTRFSQFVSTGQAKLNYSTLTLSSADRNFTVFTLSADTLSNTSTIKYDFPATTTVVINVMGTAVTLKNIGFQTPPGGTLSDLKPNRVLWNFPQAKTITAQSVSFPGTVLAPFADVDIRWGAIEGTMVASSLNAFYEFHWVPFTKNLLVP